MGAITDVVKRYVPASYRAMVGISSSYYGATEIQGLADYVKYRLFATVVAASAEASVYDPLLLTFLGKLTTLQFIPAAVDYWGDQLLQESTTGTNETIMYPDRRQELWKLFDVLRAEVKEDYSEMSEIYGFRIYGTRGLLPQVTYGDNGRKILVTSDPQAFGGAYDPNVVLTDLGLVWTQGGGS